MKLTTAIGLAFIFMPVSWFATTAYEKKMPVPSDLRDAVTDYPPSIPVGPAGAIAGFQEEPNTFPVKTPMGSFQVVIEPSGRAARKLIHDARAKDLYGGKSVEQVQKEMVREGSKSGASVIIGFTQDGNLVGTYKDKGGSPRQLRLYSYSLNDEGTTSKVIMSGGKFEGKPALFVRLLDFDGNEKSWIIVTVDNTITIGMDFRIGAK